MSRSNVAAIILAAGEATRFGSPKQLLDWDGRPLVVHSVDTAWGADCVPVIVVLGAHAEKIAPVLRNRPISILHNYRWHQGMSSSISVGLSALSPEVDAAIFIPIDQPLISPQLLRDLITCWQETHTGIVIPTTTKGQRGTPVLFARDFFPELANLSGDVGGRTLFSKYADRLTHLPVDDADTLADMDTPADYLRLQARARQAKQTPDFIQFRGIICDMDGVLWRGQTPLPGLHDFFNLIRAQNLEYVLVTNNSSRTPQMYVDKLAKMGVQTTTEHVLNSSLGAADYLSTISLSGSSVYPIGGPGLFDALRSRDFRISDGDQADYVVVGWDQKLTWKKLAIGTRLIRAGAGFIGTNPDLTFPMENALAPGNGAQLAALEVSTGVKPVVAGKPFPILYQQALSRMHLPPEQTLVIGDRLDTDILGGVRMGISTALVLSGISQREDLASSPIHPTMIFHDLAALVVAWRKGINEK